MANLEQAAMTTLQSGVDPYPKDIPEYEEKNMQNWMSYIPQTAREYPAALGRARKRETKEIESGIPEAYRKSAQEGFRRGIRGSGVQIEQVGLAGIDLQNRIAQARSREEIDPMQAQIALEDRAKKAYVDRGKQELSDFQRQEDVTTKQRMQDREMQARLAAAGIGLLGKDNPFSRAVFGGKGQEGLLQKTIGGIGSLFGGGDTSMVTPEMMQYGRVGKDVDLEEQGLLAPGQTMTPPPLFGTGMDAQSMQMPSSYYDQTPTDTATDQQFLPTQEQMLEGEGGGMYGGTSPYRDITTYEGEQQFPMPDQQFLPTQEQMLAGEGGPSMMGGDISPFGTGMDEASMQMPPSYGGGGFSGYDGADDFSFAGDLGELSILEKFQNQNRFTPVPTGSTGFETEIMPFVGTQSPDIYDFDFDNFLGPDLYEEDYFDFSKASGTPSTDASEAMIKAMDQGFVNAETTQKLLDEGKIGTEYASLLSDASDYVKDTLPESGTDLLSTAGDIAKLPFKALDLGLEAVGSAKRTVGDLTTKALDAATGGAYSGIRGLGGQATKAVSEALGGVVSPSTVGSAALTALRGTDGLKSIAKDPFGFAGKKILSSALPSFKSTVSALAKGSLPSLPAASLGAKALASNIAYDAALAKGLTVAAADKAALAAYSTGSNALLAAAPVAIPMILMSIGAQQTAKQRAKAKREEMINRAGSAPFNFVPGELAMVGNARRSPVLDEANRNFMMTDQLTGMGKIYTEDPRRSVMGGDSLSKRGQDFGREAGIDYKHSDPDVQNTSQKWLGKQQLYSELIPDLKPIFMAGLKGEMSREETEDAVSFYSNKFFKENPAIGQINGINNRIKDIAHQEADEIDSGIVQDQIMALKEQAKQSYQKVPLAWRNVSGLMPQELKVEFTKDDRYVESED